MEKGIEPKSQVAIVLNGPFKWDQTERVAIRAMANVLQERLREAIREELGGTYSISASAGIQKLPRSEYTFSIQFGGDPKRVGDLVKRVYQEIDKLTAELGKGNLSEAERQKLASRISEWWHVATKWLKAKTK